MSLQGISRAFRAQRLTQWQVWLERLVVWGAAVATGAVIVLFARAGAWAGELFAHAQSLSPWAGLVITPRAGMLIIAISSRWFPGIQGSGIPQTIAALETKDGSLDRGRFLSLRIAFGKVWLGTLALAGGFSVGREGPSVQIGASIMYAFRRLLPQGHSIRASDMILAGGAAGIAAAFNTPLAGIVFAIEELSRRFEQRTNGVLLTAIVLAGFVFISMQGNYLYFGHLTVTMIDHRIIWPVMVCGVVCGTAGAIMSRLMLYSTTTWTGLFGRIRHGRPIVFAGICGLLVAILGLMTHGEIHGSGYLTTQAILNNDVVVEWYYAPAKLLAMVLSYFSGIPGGIFAPSLAIGAGIGNNLMPLFSDIAVAGSFYALCMAAFMAGVTQAAGTSFLLAMAMIHGH